MVLEVWNPFQEGPKMHRTYIRIPAHFYRISLHTAVDSMTLALVPDENHANLIAGLLNEHYGVRKGESIMVTPTVIRQEDGHPPANADFSRQPESARSAGNPARSRAASPAGPA
jgi:hypothetical protein